MIGRIDLWLGNHVNQRFVIPAKNYRSDTQNYLTDCKFYVLNISIKNSSLV